MKEMMQISIVHASEGGTAQDMAESIWRQALKRQFLNVTIQSAKELSFDDLLNIKGLIILIIATYGQGDLPKSMQDLWRELCRKSLAADTFIQHRFALLGIGNSKYEKFNFAIKKVHRRLLQLGGSIFHRVGLADEQHDLGLDGVADPWLNDLWILLDAPPETDTDIPPKYSVESISLLEPVTEIISESKVPLIGNSRVTSATHWQDTRLFEFDIGDTNIRYSPGDVVCIQPLNLSEDIAMFLELINATEHEIDAPIKLKKGACTSLPPSYMINANNTTFRECVQRYFDLHSLPRLSFLQQLISYAEPGSREKERLSEFCASENQNDLFDYVNRSRRTIIEFLQDFKGVAKRVPLFRWFDLIPAIAMRSFSIASCQEVHQNRLQLLIAIVDYKVPRMHNRRLGLCTNYLKRLELNTDVTLWVQSSTLSKTFSAVARSQDIHCLLVGPGTGVAPLRSLLHQRNLNAIESRINTILIFGCRSGEADYYFKDEYCTMPFLQVLTAFSREKSKPVVYVQHRIAKEQDLIARMLSTENSCVVVCGNANKMPQEVKEAIISTLNNSKRDGKAEVERMIKEARYATEFWS